MGVEFKAALNLQSFETFSPIFGLKRLFFSYDPCQIKHVLLSKPYP